MMEASAYADEDEASSTTATQQQFLAMFPPSSATTTTASTTSTPQQYRRYYGLIKREPQEFEVREIDLHGRVADITRPVTLLAPPPPHQQPPAAPMVDAPIPPLEELLAPEHVAALTALQARVEAAVLQDAMEESTEAGGLLAARIELPLPDDKEARGRLHRAVRARCPCLQTSQEQAVAVAGQPPPGPLHLVARAGLGVHRQMRRLLPDPKQSLALYAFVARGRADAGAPAGVVLGPLASKNSRKALYSLVSDTFPQLKMTTTQGEGKGEVGHAGGSTMLAQWKEQEPGRGSKKRKRGQDAPAAAPSVHRFVLRKEDTEQLDALRRLGMRLRVPPKRLAYAGAKDRRAVTFQFITAQNLPPDRVARLANLRIPGPAHKPALQLGDLEAGWPRPLQLGDNQGNAFRIRVRGVWPATATATTTTTTTDDEAASWRAELEGRLGQLKARGFVNYFGQQRLSPLRGRGPDAWEVGRAMLRRDWEGVKRLVLGPREWDSEKLKKAKAEFWEGTLSPKQLRQHCPDSLHREKLFLKGLAVHGQHNVNKALLFVPHHNRTQWANAYQSYLWNRAASEHMRLYGCRAVEGDLVLLPPAPAPGKGEGASNKEKPRARALTQAEVEGAKGEGLLYEVVLPLPGPGVEMPGGGVGELYKQMLEADGLWDLLRHGKEKDGLEEIDPVVTVTGAYRKLLERPHGLEWTIAGGPSAAKAPELTLDLSFSLGSGEYATTVLGEVLGGEPESYLPPFVQPREPEPGVTDGGGAEEGGLKASKAGDEGSGDEGGGELDGKEGMVDM